METNELIRTFFSYPTNEELYVFLDIPYAFLFSRKKGYYIKWTQ
ncbi:hypothetical protein KHA80_20870 [Anaerobacillus sp. HL2]|nr:hypothetical protein KHA80_20870 [Anaerobacillus sp. HL2]